MFEVGFPVVKEGVGGEFGEEEGEGEEDKKGQKKVGAEMVWKGVFVAKRIAEGKKVEVGSEELDESAERDEEGERGGQEHGEDALADEGSGENGDAVDEAELGDGPEGLEFGLEWDFGELEGIGIEPITEGISAWRLEISVEGKEDVEEARNDKGGERDEETGEVASIEIERRVKGAGEPEVIEPMLEVGNADVAADDEGGKERTIGEEGCQPVDKADVAKAGKPDAAGEEGIGGGIAVGNDEESGKEVEANEVAGFTPRFPEDG